jgi:hypothetical protein
MKIILYIFTQLYYTFCMFTKSARFHSPCANLRNSLYTQPSNITEFLDLKLKELDEITLEVDFSEVVVCSLSNKIKLKHDIMLNNSNISKEYIEIHNNLHVLTSSKGENALSRDYEKFNEAVINYYTDQVMIKRGMIHPENKNEKLIKLLIDSVGEQGLYDVVFFDKVEEFLKTLIEKFKSKCRGEAKSLLIDIEKSFKEWNNDNLLKKLTQNC